MIFTNVAYRVEKHYQQLPNVMVDDWAVCSEEEVTYRLAEEELVLVEEALYLKIRKNLFSLQKKIKLIFIQLRVLLVYYFVYTTYYNFY